jgi:hypothetical protein
MSKINLDEIAAKMPMPGWKEAEMRKCRAILDEHLVFTHVARMNDLLPPIPNFKKPKNKK